MATAFEFVTDQLSSIDKLIVLLQQETQALQDQDANRISELAKSKLDILVLLNQADQQLQNHPQLNQQKQNPAFQAVVAQVQQKMDQVKRINLNNKKIIDLNMAALKRLNHALQSSRNANSMTYNDKGQTHTSPFLGDDITA
ncbi:flagellar protein FlgN [Paraferrimonas sp. SM1919]|uniref:flagellar protein FlgN n=1 Tax=Paraferrimonas sp. SM1919 TaxID=2662263 RepID=UPI0013D36F62|nr:flagellar protein FlgN [Paraferrimonas sp. SM1919]